MRRLFQLVAKIKTAASISAIMRRSNTAQIAGRLPAWLRATSRTAAATTTAAAATAATAAAITAKATSTTTATIFAWPGFVDFQGTTANFLSVELFNRCSRFCFRRHFDEGETLR